MGGPPFSPDEMEDLFSHTELEYHRLLRSRLFTGYFSIVTLVGAYYAYLSFMS
jgi:hypothetical protein